MAEGVKDIRRDPRSVGHIAIVTSLVIIAIMLFVGLQQAFEAYRKSVYWYNQEGFVPIMEFVSTLLLWATMALMPLLLAAAIVIVVKLRRLGELLNGQNGGSSSTSLSSDSAATVAGDSPAAKPAVSKPPTLAACVEMLVAIQARVDDIDSHLMLTDEQRELRRRQHQGKLADHLVSQIQKGIAAGDFPAAQLAMVKLSSELPDDPRCEKMRQQVENAGKEYQIRQLETCRKQVDSLIALREFSHAQSLARECVAANPNLEQAAEIAAHVTREENAYHAQRRRESCNQVETHIREKQWRQAITEGNRLIEAYPDSPESQLLKAQMPTLQNNARIEEVRQMRDAILELIERRRFADAVTMSRVLIRDFPDTTAAEELASRIPKLEELASRAAQ